MGYVRHDTTPFAGCPQTQKICPLVFAFLARLAHGVALANAVTGQCPDMSGELCLQDCPLGEKCQLTWQSRDGVVSVHDGARKVLQMPLSSAGAS